MPVLVTSNFDDDSIKNEQASMETPFSHYNFLDLKSRYSVVIGPIWSEIRTHPRFYARSCYLQV